ncbi:hypothetical protein [Tunturiibacter gelidiferens]|uniref:bestrophin-like domain n=1 Tax=Tunturiibacter gelidiferens TaxID=3069689 RepID=UPI003D9AB683
MDSIISAPVFAIALFLGMLLFLEIGRQLRRHRTVLAGDEHSGSGAVEGAVFALFGLMVAFSFSGAAARFDARRALIVDEANDIGTAYLRVEMLAPSDQPAMRGLFRNYLDSRLEVYRKLPDIAAVERELTRSAEIQSDIWKKAVAETRSQGAHPDSGKLLLPAINTMIDITTTRTVAARTHPPIILFYLLLVLGLAQSLLAGFSMAGANRRSWLHLLAFAMITVVVVYVIVDLEFPRFGLIRIDKYDQVLVDLRNSMT